MKFVVALRWELGTGELEASQIWRNVLRELRLLQILASGQPNIISIQSAETILVLKDLYVFHLKTIWPCVGRISVLLEDSAFQMKLFQCFGQQSLSVGH